MEALLGFLLIFVVWGGFVVWARKNNLSWTVALGGGFVFVMVGLFMIILSVK